MINIGDFLNRKSRSYDCTQSKITIAGIEVDSIMTASIKVSESYSAERGIGKSYYTAIKQNEVYTLDISLLPMSECYDSLMQLKEYCDVNNTYFGITVVENGSFFGNFDAHFVQLSSLGISEEPENKSFSFAMLKADDGLLRLTTGSASYYSDIPLDNYGDF